MVEPLQGRSALHLRGVTKLLAVEVSVGQLALAVTCAVVAAASYGLSNVLQQHEAEQLPEESALERPVNCGDALEQRLRVRKAGREIRTRRAERLG